MLVEAPAAELLGHHLGRPEIHHVERPERDHLRHAAQRRRRQPVAPRRQHAADQLVGGILSAGPDRLTAAALRGVPQVISLGALDMVNFGPPDTVPEKFRGRRFYPHNPTVTLMRTTPEENDALGKEIAHKASAAKGPTAVLVPRRGVSAIDREGQPFWWPEADDALFQSLRTWMSPHVELIELDLHINDPAFAAACANKLLELMANRARTEGPSAKRAGFGG